VDIPALASLVVASLLIELTPGPNMAWLALLAATEGRARGFAAVAGVTVGLGLLGLLSATGLASLLASAPVLYQAVRLAGVAYLLWLAWEAWFRAGRAEAGDDVGLPAWIQFRRGIITNLLNPKAMVVYVTVIPSFSAPHADVAERLTAAGLYLLVATLVHAAIVTAAGTAHGFLSRPARIATARRLMAAGLVGVAIWLLTRT
jgi:threonine/homoserine/homoserine lactone efflux protein